MNATGARLTTHDLIERGWVRMDDGWRRPGFAFAWPFGDAVRLEREADGGNTRALLLLDR